MFQEEPQVEALMKALKGVQVSTHRAGIKVAISSMEHQTETITCRWQEFHQATLTNVVSLSLLEHGMPPPRDLIAGFRHSRHEANDVALLVSNLSQQLFILESELRLLAGLSHEQS